MPAAPVRPDVEQVGTSEAEHQHGGAHELDERLHEVEERGRRPVHVVEDEHQGVLQRDAREQPAGRERRVLRARASGREADGDGQLLGELRAAVRSEALADPPGDIAAGERGQHVAERRVRRLPRVGAAAADGGGRHLAKALRALRRQARLPDSRCPEDGDEVRTAFGGRALERIDDLAEFPVAPDERRLEAAEQRRRVGVDRVDRPRVLPRRGRDGVAHAAPRPGGGEHLSRVGSLLEPRGFVDRRARHERIAGHDLPGGDADASRDGGRAERDGRRERAQRIVVLRRGDAEHAEHAPAAE